jgi:ECF sigma factor
MAEPLSQEVTRLLIAWRRGEPAALDELIPLVYGELRRIAAHYLRQERRGHTLQTSALVNEAFLRLVDQTVDWRNRAQFFGIAARHRPGAVALMPTVSLVDFHIRVELQAKLAGRK